MVCFKLKGLLQNDTWLSPAYVQVDNDGVIISISNEKLKQNSHEIVEVNMDAYALPGFQNAHSHAFQYAMAGIAETHATGSTPDDFWSWREAMYKLALSINPDDLETIATMLYFEMLRHGYTHVAEFHYVHHNQNGKRYEQLNEMSSRLIQAAKKVGIGITLVPIFYQKGGFGKEPTEGQRRFISKNEEDYLKLYDSVVQSCKEYKHSNTAIGIHSLRGVEPEQVKNISKQGPQNVPFHIHISEQLKEVEDCLAYTGKRPVEWMLNNVDMNSRFHLVHATHLNEDEIKGIANSKANVVLCPSTEGNLGDGFFPLTKFQNYGGSWSIGTDSHVGLNPLEELRILDYGQRLLTHKRNSYFSSNEGDSGKFAINMITESGRKAMNNFDSTYFKIGQFFNASLIDASSPLIACTENEKLLSTIVYATDAAHQIGTIAKGKLIQFNSENEDYLVAKRDFKNCIAQLKNRC